MVMITPMKRSRLLTRSVARTQAKINKLGSKVPVGSAVILTNYKGILMSFAFKYNQTKDAPNNLTRKLASISTHNLSQLTKCTSKVLFSRIMGNCIALQKEIKIIKPDGETLEYKAPMKVRQVLSEFAGHAISDTLPVVQHLHPDADMIGGFEYYLLPLPEVPPPTGKSTIKFSKPVVAAGQGSGVVRIKLVISKQELQAMLQRGGVTVGDMIPKLQKEEIMKGVDSFGSDDKITSTGWKPMLESIPEGN